MQAPNNWSRWEEKLQRSGFFFGALLLHLVVFLLVATYVVSRPPPVPPEVTVRYVPLPPQEAVPPPAHESQAPAMAVDLVSSGPQIPITSNVNASDFYLLVSPMDSTGIVKSTAPSSIDVPRNNGLSPDRSDRVRRGPLRYRTPQEIRDHDPASIFPVYVAAYARGDWACNTRLDKNGNIIAGSIPDLVAKINEWSHGSIKGEVVPKPLDIGSAELLNKMPPFIFFTGHKDFVLTDAEVANLRDYLEDGGAIWGDNALAGHGSRFDVAFHREMKRVVPDHAFEAVPMDSAIFTKGKFAIPQVPTGINYHSEPIEHLDIDGVLAILYTPNDYSDLYAMRILPGDTQIQLGRLDPQTQPPLTTSYLLQSHRTVFFRNFTLQSSLAVHRLGMNIVTYLLTRFDDKLQLGH